MDTTGPTYTKEISLSDVTIKASDDKSGLHASAYSCDGVWQKSNICKFKTIGSHKINVKDALENIGTEETITITELSPSEPELKGMTPVIYQNNKWVVADTSKKWYDYAKQEWANAVILNEGINKTAGQELNLETDVRAMFVWIPRYEYKIEGPYGKGGTSAESPGEIEINFILKDTIHENVNSNGYRVHPAFTFGTEELSGIWVGKFETSHTILSASTENNNLQCSNNNCANADGLRILPNVSSIRYNNVSNFFYAAQSMNKKLNISGDLHMMKNSEWGVVAYLSQSKYGKYGNSLYNLTNKEVTMNESSSYLTGDGDYVANIAQSTTGNITGIYDMNSGAWEYVMGVYDNNISNSGFVSLPESKYYDNYTSTDSSMACNGVCYGHALSETAGWYGDHSYFLSSAWAWLGRGGSTYSGNHAGMYASSGVNNDSLFATSFRIVVAPIT